MGDLVAEELTLFCHFVLVNVVFLQSEGDPSDAFSVKSIETSSEQVSFYFG